MVRGKPIVLKGGDYLPPIYHETGHDQEFVGPDTTSLFRATMHKQKVDGKQPDSLAHRQSVACVAVDGRLPGLLLPGARRL